MLRRLSCLLFFLVVFLVTQPASRAADFYVSQNGGGAGSSCTDTLSAAWFNTAANWVTQIVPGSTVHLCNTFTGAANARLLTAMGSGTSTAPITIKFEAGAVLTAPYWNQYGALNLAGRAYLVVDGGNVGVIVNTDNGTGRKYQQSSTAIFAYQCTGCAVKNLTIANLYVRTSKSDLALGSASQVSCTYSAYANNFTIDHVLCHDVGWAFGGGGNNFKVTNSEAYNMDHGLAFGASGTFIGPTITGNHFHDFAAWDSTDGRYHHDGIHLWGNGPHNIVLGGVIDGNTFDGDSGSCCTTAWIFLQSAIQNVSVTNNRIMVTAGRSIIPIEPAWWDNTVYPVGTLPQDKLAPAIGNIVSHNLVVVNSGISGLRVMGQQNFTFTNNIILGGNGDVGFQTTTFAAIDNNVYEDVLKDWGSFNMLSRDGKSYHDLASWQAACGCDKNSRVVSLK